MPEIIATTRQSPKERMLAFISDWERMTTSTSASFQTGRTADGHPAIMITIGARDHYFDEKDVQFLIETIDRSAKDCEAPDGSEFDVMKQVLENAIAMARLTLGLKQ